MDPVTQGAFGAIFAQTMPSKIKASGIMA